jgi:DNA-directed RNA polymerase subunit RPC12/RpoP
MDFTNLLEILCSHCGKKLYVGMDIKSPRQILKLYNNRCKYCGKELHEYGFKVNIAKSMF